MLQAHKEKNMSATGIEVRLATSGDVDSMVHLRLRYLKREDGGEPSPVTIKRGISTVLERGSDAGLLWVALVGPEIVGWAMVFMEVSEWRAGLVWYLKNITVDPSSENNQEVADALHHAAQSAMKSSPTSNGLRVYTHTAAHESPIQQKPPKVISTPLKDSVRQVGPFEVEHYYLMSAVKPEYKEFAHSC
jgi:hypothetical protein